MRGDRDRDRFFIAPSAPWGERWQGRRGIPRGPGPGSPDCAALQDGQRLSARCDGPQGFWGLPPLQRAEHLVKIRDCLGVRLDAEQTEQCIQLVETLETLQSSEIAQLMALIG